MFHCPKCHADNVHRSRTKSWLERWRRDITGRRPYRCRACNWRGWLESGLIPSSSDQVGLRDGSRTPDAPNLRGTLLARADPRRQVDLKKLDSFHSQPHKDDV